jgi:hypothetical protein
VIKPALQWLSIASVILVAYFVLRPSFGPRDHIKIDLWITKGSTYLYGLNTGIWGKTTQGILGLIADGEDAHLNFQDRISSTRRYTFWFAPGKMESFKVKMYRNGKLCANSYKNFDKNYKFTNDNFNTYLIRCNGPKSGT